LIYGIPPIEMLSYLKNKLTRGVEEHSMEGVNDK
jgi:hypothetical protein